MLLGLTMHVFASAAETDTGAPEPGALAQRTEQLKQQAVEFNRDLLLLEDSTIPADNRVTVFVSQSRSLSMTVDSAEIQIDPDVSIRKRYTAAEGDALHKGGSHRLYMGALSPGRHVLNASLSARDANGTPRRFSSKLSFRAGHGAKTLEIELSGLDPGSLDLAIHESN